MKKIIVMVSFFFIFFIFLQNVSAQSYVGDPGDYAPIFQAPANCPDDFIADLACSRAKVLNATTVCFENKCPGAPGYGSDASTAGVDTFQELEVFGAKFYINSSQRIAAIINIGFSTFLGIVSLYALVRGIYVGGFKRAGTTEAETIASANKELVNLIIGFALAWSFIFILQFVMGLLGFGSINELVLVGDQSDNPEIVIRSN